MENEGVVSTFYKSRNGLDNQYTLYSSGKILREYDRHIYSGGSNLKEVLSADQINAGIKDELLSAASPENKELVKSLLGMMP